MKKDNPENERTFRDRAENCIHITKVRGHEVVGLHRGVHIPR
jgi:hypothetical protein